MKEGISRRALLAGGAAALAAGGLLPWWRNLAVAQGAPERRNLVLVFAGGGWDATACLDPKQGLTTIDSPAGQIKAFGRLNILTGSDRPAVERFFNDHGDISAVVNGVEVRSIAHEECTRRIMTGTNSDQSPDLGAIVGVEHGADLAVPYMILGNTAFTGPLAGTSGRAGTTGQIVTVMDPSGAYEPPGGRRKPRYSPDEEEAALIRDYVKARSQADMDRRAQRGLNRARMEDLRSSLDRGDRLKRLFANFGERTFQLEYRPQIELAVKMLKEGISRTVMIEHPGDWDSHNDNDARQLPLYQDLFDGLSDLARRLEAGGLLDDTVVVVISEMSRTPKLNDQAGKDHWPVTSALVFGGPVAGGKTLGGTTDLFESAPTNLANGRLDPEGGRLTASNFVAGVLDLVNVDAGDHLPGTAILKGLKA